MMIKGSGGEYGHASVGHLGALMLFSLRKRGKVETDGRSLWGCFQLRKMAFRDVTSTAMIYIESPSATISDT